MTREQKNWLDANKRYRVLGQIATGGSKIVASGMLHADGTFVAAERGKRLPVRVGSFEVAIIEAKA